jgi:pterin-4a-carbinolamine dehydratase
MVMSAALSLPEGWEMVERPPSLFRRYQFGSYKETRGFLDRLSALSKETGVYPDLGFGPTHVNVTIYGADGTAPGGAEYAFADRVAALNPPEAT